MTEITDELIELDDLREPRFTPEVAEVRAAMELMALECPLDADVLHHRASAETGLSDFGPEDYRERLDVFLSSVREIEDLNGSGRLTYYTHVISWLKNRLLLQDLLTRHPEIHDIELAPPIIIAGLPRTGTTHLHNLMAAAPAFRTLPLWESIQPFPLPAEAGIEPDPRLARTDGFVDFTHQAMPHFRLMHEMTTDYVQEEVQLLANDFSSMMMEILGQVPRWRDYYLDHDQTSSYEYLRLQLQALQFLRGGRRWLLKSPQHLEQLPVLKRVFGDATYVFTHRDPVPAALSLIAMVTYSARMHRTPVPVEEIAAEWVDRLGVLFDALVRDRDLFDPEQSMDIRFDDFMADDLAVTEQVFALAGEQPTDADRSAMADYLDVHRRGRLGKVRIDAAMFGLDEQQLRERFAGYTARFLS